MSYTYPSGMPQGTARPFTNKLREILIAEVIAINGYQTHIANSNMPEINAAWHNIMGDEKRHYGMILELLRKYDPAEYKAYLLHKEARLGPKDPMQDYKPEYDRQIILNNLRDDIKGELEAVILYEEQLPEFRYADIRSSLHTIINEEKEHTEHLTELVLKYDSDPYGNLS